MPPWFTDPSYGAFSNDCQLPRKDIDTIAAWVEGGAKEGDPKELKRPFLHADQVRRCVVFNIKGMISG